MRAGHALRYAIAIMVLWPGHARAQSLVDSARAVAERGHPDSAYTLISSAASASPDSAEVQFWLGEIAALRAREEGGLGAFFTARHAKSGFARAVALRPREPDYLEGLAEFLVQVPGIAGGNRDSAVAVAERMAGLDSVRGTLVLADVLRRTGERGERRGDSLVRAIAAVHPGDRLVQGGVANYWAGTGRPALGLPIYERLLAEDSTDVIARFGLARMLLESGGDPRRALQNLEYGLAHARPERLLPRPGSADYFYPIPVQWWRLGQAYGRLGVADSARTCYEQALHLRPEFRQARLSLDSLSRR